MENIKVVGNIEFDNQLLPVYSSLDQPLFKASDIANMIDYSEGNTWKMLEVCEEDEKLKLPIIDGRQTRHVWFVTKSGLMEILFQSRQPMAKIIRRVILDELIELRRSSEMNIVEQFEHWNSRL